jgi:hypothetical protein
MLRTEQEIKAAIVEYAQYNCWGLVEILLWV